jgi:hypothetical protein
VWGTVIKEPVKINTDENLVSDTKGIKKYSNAFQCYLFLYVFYKDKIEIHIFVKHLMPFKTFLQLVFIWPSSSLCVKVGFLVFIIPSDHLE